MDLASEAVHDKAYVCVFCVGFMGYVIRHVELDKLPKLNEEIERKSPINKDLLSNLAFENDCLKIHFSTNQMQIKLNEFNKTNNHLR